MTANRSSWFKAFRDSPDELCCNHPNAFRLLYLIAKRARWRVGLNDGISIGEALLGDWEQMGMTRQEYRSAVKLLTRLGLATFRVIQGKGTIGKLAGDHVFAVTDQNSTTYPSDEVTTSATTYRDQNHCDNTDEFCAVRSNSNHQNGHVEFAETTTDQPRANHLTTTSQPLTKRNRRKAGKIEVDPKDPLGLRASAKASAEIQSPAERAHARRDSEMIEIWDDEEDRAMTDAELKEFERSLRSKRRRKLKPEPSTEIEFDES